MAGSSVRARLLREAPLRALAGHRVRAGDRPRCRALAGARMRRGARPRAEVPRPREALQEAPQARAERHREERPKGPGETSRRGVPPPPAGQPQEALSVPGELSVRAEPPRTRWRPTRPRVAPGTPRTGSPKGRVSGCTEGSTSGSQTPATSPAAAIWSTRAQSTRRRARADWFATSAPPTTAGGTRPSGWKTAKGPATEGLLRLDLRRRDGLDAPGLGERGRLQRLPAVVRDHRPGRE